MHYLQRMKSNEKTRIERRPRDVLDALPPLVPEGPIEPSATEVALWWARTRGDSQDDVKAPRS